MTASAEKVMRLTLIATPENHKSRLFLLALAALCLLACPDLAAASGGITEFSSPLEKVVNTITGPAGKWISIVAMAICGIIFIMNKNENNTFLLSEKVLFIKYYH